MEGRLYWFLSQIGEEARDIMGMSETSDGESHGGKIATSLIFPYKSHQCRIP